MNLSGNEAEDHNHSYQKEGRNKNVVKDRVDRSANIYQRNHYQPEREMGPWLLEYDREEQQD